MTVSRSTAAATTEVRIEVVTGGGVLRGTDAICMPRPRP